MKNISIAKAFLEYSDQSLSELTEILTRAKELAISQSSDASASEQSRRLTASEVDQLHGQALLVGNRRFGDRFLFGGFKTTRPPFDQEGRYLGDQGEIKIAVQKNGGVAMNVPGSLVFLGHKPEVTSSQALRGPASFEATKTDSEISPSEQPDEQNSGVNVFKVLKDLSIGLRANDKETIQETLDHIDGALAQVISSRSQVGSRVATLNHALESLQKNQVDAKGLISNLEDVDTFELVSEINKTESTLKAALSTSGKLVQPSLLDFLR
jgi:flagellar hook-associated protein 3 FlgL